MVIQHNMNAMNANRQLGLVTGSFAKSSEKLSSGYRINRAADDAAGLSISEKMRTQVRGLTRASENIEDGISLCQVADGALNETVDILQRMRELAVQSANGTNSESDRQYIEMEITQMKSEIDRIAETTKFNDVVYPLNAPITYGSIVTETIGSSGSNWIDGLLYETTVTFKTNVSCTYDGINYKVGDEITVEGLSTNGKEIWVFGGCAWVGSWAANTIGSTTINNLKSLKISDLKTDKDGYLYYDLSGTKMYALYYEEFNGLNDPMHFRDYAGALEQIQREAGRLRFMTVADLGIQRPVTPPVNQTNNKYYFNDGIKIEIQAGASSSQADKIRIRTVNATCKGLGILDVRLVTEDSSTQSLDLLDKAIVKASSYRSMFGATQNRLEHAKKIDDNTVENTQAAESIIRDTDMANEMVRYSNSNILAQAGQTMLSQANQSNQGVLSLVA